MKKLHALFMNDMRSAKYEYRTLIAVADTREQLERFLQGQRVKPYQDGRWAKNFQQGGPLEWYNVGTDEITEVGYLAA